MMSIDYINQLADEAGNTARRRKTQPRVFDARRLETLGQPGDLIPNLGSFRPRGWRLRESKLCDSSGFGAEDEPALTLAGLKRWIAANPQSGFATLTAGQFQVEVGRFERVEEVLP